ncbi:MAG: DUF4386 domain-containing protein [Spirochaetia bacterium]|nr:DUF4386 domain-containing protein [Spirochaetia bacterium]
MKTENTSPNRTAKYAALLHLALAVLSGFSFMGVDNRILVEGNAAATAHNVAAMDGLIRVGLIANLAGQAIFLFLAHALYKLLSPVDKGLARLMVILVVASVPIAFLNSLNQLAAVQLLGQSTSLAAFTTTQLQALAMVFLKLQFLGTMIAQVFWGLWLFPFGLLVYRSGFLPRFVGVLLMLGCFGYLADSFLAFTFPALSAYAAPGIWVSAIAELSFIFWVLIRGIKIKTFSKEST